MKQNICTDMTKQNQFVEKLSAILNKPDSTIAVSFLASLTTGGAVLFLATDSQVKKGIDIDVKYSSFEFDFVKPFAKDKYAQDMLVSSGISDSDVADLSALFEEYTFINPAEGLFFSSKFFYTAEGRIADNMVYFKFKADESLYTSVIDGKNLYKSYGFVPEEKLVALAIPPVAPNVLVELAPNHMPSRPDKDFVLNRIKDTDFKNVACELYFDMQTGVTYAGNVLSVVDGETVERPLASIL